MITCCFSDSPKMITDSLHHVFEFNFWLLFHLSLSCFLFLSFCLCRLVGQTRPNLVYWINHKIVVFFFIKLLLTINHIFNVSKFATVVYLQFWQSMLNFRLLIVPWTLMSTLRYSRLLQVGLEMISDCWVFWIKNWFQSLWPLRLGWHVHLRWNLFLK